MTLRAAALCAAGCLAAVGAARGQVLDPYDPSEPVMVPVLQGMADLVCPIEIHDFGTIYDDSPVEVVLPFVNRGVGTLEITDIHSSCGCTVAELDGQKYEKGSTKLYPPGAWGYLKVQFSPTNKRGFKANRVTITSNDPDEPRKDLVVESTVIPVVEVDPLLLNIGRVPEGQSATRTIKVTGRSEDFAATYATISQGVLADHVKAEIVGTETAEVNGEKLRTTTIDVTLDDTAPRGLVNGTLVIRTNDQRRPLVNLPLRGDVIGDIQAVPTRVSMGVALTGAEFKRQVELTSTAGKPFEVTGVRQETNLTGDAFDIVVNPTEDGAAPSHTITFSITPTEPARVMGKFVVEIVTADGRAEEILLPVYGQVRPEGFVPTRTGTAGARATPPAGAAGGSGSDQ